MKHWSMAAFHGLAHTAIFELQIDANAARVQDPDLMSGPIVEALLGVTTGADPFFVVDEER